MSNLHIFSVIGHDIVLTARVLLVFTVIELAMKKILGTHCNNVPNSQYITILTNNILN